MGKQTGKTQLFFLTLLLCKLLVQFCLLTFFFKGDGNMVYQNGDVYEGQWKVGLRHGNGNFFRFHPDSTFPEFSQEF
jgi:hypothetical protein